MKHYLRPVSACCGTGAWKKNLLWITGIVFFFSLLSSAATGSPVIFPGHTFMYVQEPAFTGPARDVPREAAEYERSCPLAPTYINHRLSSQDPLQCREKSAFHQSSPGYPESTALLPDGISSIIPSCLAPSSFTTRAPPAPGLTR